MSAYRDSLPPEQRPAYDRAVKAAGQILSRARAERDSLPPREAAERAYVVGGMSVDEIEALIRQHRAEARAERDAKGEAA